MKETKTTKLELTEREVGLIKECLLMVAKMQGVAPDQMKELIALHDKIGSEHEKENND